MSSSSLRNAVHRRNHKERGQLGSRAKLGLLEKHKDYVERAKDHHAKRDRLQRLQQKASLRNKDEFNFGMIRGASNDLLAKVRGTVKHRTARPTSHGDLPNDLVAILKSQDVGYIRNAARAEEKRIEALKQQIRPALPQLPMSWLQEKEGRAEALQRHGLWQPAQQAGSRGAIASSSKLGLAGKKTVFVDSVEEARAMESSSSSSPGKAKAKAGPYDEEFGSLASMAKFDDSDGSEEEMEQEEGLDEGATMQQRFERRMAKLLNELNSRQDRLDALQEARQKLETVRYLMTTKGQSVRKATLEKRQDELVSALVKGAKTTRNGLVLPGPDEGEDSDEEEVGQTKAKKSVFKWGNERKR